MATCRHGRWRCSSSRASLPTGRRACSLRPPRRRGPSCRPPYSTRSLRASAQQLARMRSAGPRLTRYAHPTCRCVCALASHSQPRAHGVYGAGRGDPAAHRLTRVVTPLRHWRRARRTYVLLFVALLGRPRRVPRLPSHDRMAAAAPAAAHRPLPSTSRIPRCARCRCGVGHADRRPLPTRRCDHPRQRVTHARPLQGRSASRAPLARDAQPRHHAAHAALDGRRLAQGL